MNGMLIKCICVSGAAEPTEQTMHHAANVSHCLYNWNKTFEHLCMPLRKREMMNMYIEALAEPATACLAV